MINRTSLRLRSKSFGVRPAKGWRFGLQGWGFALTLRCGAIHAAIPLLRNHAHVFAKRRFDQREAYLGVCALDLIAV